MDEDTIVIAGLIQESVVVTKSVAIRGPSVDEATPGTHMGVVQGDGSSVFAINTNAKGCPAVTISGLNITHSTSGTGITNNCTLTLDGVTVYGAATGVENKGTLALVNSTLDLDASTGTAIKNQIGASLAITHSTLSRPIVNAGSASVQGSILAGCSGTNLTDSGNNLSTSSCSAATSTTAALLHLDPLRDNGGPTFTHALAVESSAIGVEGSSVDSCANLTADQRENAPAQPQRRTRRQV